MICGVSLSHQSVPVSGDRTTTSVPGFELTVVLQENIFGSPEHSKVVQLSHESTIAELLSAAQSPASCEALLSAMSFPNAAPLSRVHLGPSILHYAEANAREASRRRGRAPAKLKVKAIAAVESPRGLLLPPSLHILYRPTSTSSAQLSQLDMIQWGGGGEDDRPCAVCLEGFGADETVARTACRHVFHRHCIVKWLMKEGTCPLCRDRNLALLRELLNS